MHPNQDAEHRTALAEGQRPFAVLFGCSDSRLAAEMIFDQGLGDLFVVRTAGNVIGPEVLGSIEYAVDVLATPLVVVLGHDSCGAIAAAMGGLPDPVDGVVSHLGAIVERVAPSIEQARQAGVTDPDGILDRHVRRTAELLTASGGAIAAAVAEGRCAVVGMSYRLADGRVTVCCTESANAGQRRADPAASGQCLADPAASGQRRSDQLPTQAACLADA